MIKESENIIERVHHIDILKGVCIIFVVITHFSWTWDERQKIFIPILDRHGSSHFYDYFRVHIFIVI